MPGRAVRLHGEREAIFTQRQELETKLAEVNRELVAIDAYEAAMAGKLSSSLPRGRGAQPVRRGRRGSKRDQLLDLSRSIRTG